MPGTKTSQRLMDAGQYVGPRTFRSYSAVPTVVVAPAILAALLLAWGAAYLAGGSHTVFPHLFYVPVMMAAVRFGPTAAVATAVAAGLLCGPLLPADVAAGTAQEPGSWVVRTVFFVAVGLVLAWLTTHTRPGLVSRGHDARVAVGLRRALRSNQLQVHYQPQVDLESRQVTGVEALVRWAHPTRGLVPPGEFIPAAEATGLVTAIDRLVLDEATRQLATWSEAGFGELTMAVNVSARRFADPRLVADTAAALEASGVQPGRVHLEVTETAIIEDVRQAARTFGELRRLGVKIAIDDFGAGQSSLRYLHQFPVDVVKIDRGFVTDVVEDPRVGRLVAGMVRLFESIGVTVVAEGISSAEQYVHMTSLRCRVGQGFYIGRPAPPAEIEDWLRRSRARESRRSGPGRV